MKNVMVDSRRIAQIGTFDVENFGDLLFPTVLENQFKDYAVDLYSPIGNMNKPFETEKYVYSVSELDKNCQLYKYKAIIIGGGDLIHVNKLIATDYKADFYASISIWQMPILIAKKHGIPVIFNCPGVPQEFSKYEQRLVRILLSNVDYLSVRDERSREYLLQCGIQNVHVVPDSVLLIQKCYSIDDLVSVRNRLIQENVIPDWDDYLIVQHNIIHMEDVVEMKQLVNNLTNEGKKIILLPIGYVHCDEVFLNELYEDNNANIFYCRKKISPKEMCSVLAHSSGYIGTSLHGVIISYAYKKPIAAINTAQMTKIKGFLKHINKEDAEIKNIKLIEEVVQKQINSSNAGKDYSILCAQIEEHFKKMDRIILQEKVLDDKWHLIQKEILNEYHTIAEFSKGFSFQNLEACKIYFDYGKGFFEESSIVYKYDVQDNMYRISFDIPEAVRNIRVDPVENRVVILKNLEIKGDGSDIDYVISNSYLTERGILINSLDPKIEFINPTIKHLNISFSAELLSENNICNIIAQWNSYIEIMQSEKEKKMEENQELVDLCLKAKEQVEESKNISEELQKEITQKEHELTAEKQKRIEVEEELCVTYESLTQAQQCIEKMQRNITRLEENLGEKDVQFKGMDTELDNQKNINFELSNQVLQLHQDILELNQRIEHIYSSTSWRISKPIRIIGDKLRWLIHNFILLRKCYTATLILKEGGLKLLLYHIRHYHEKHEEVLPQQQYDLSVKSEYQNDIDFKEYQSDVKMLAFYLPQYHTFKENDEWWGKGFTEWTNVRNGNPRFTGHYQPRVPHEDIGYYDLTDISVLKKQAELARQHGIYGFCFYYYWFSGKRLMEKPVDMLLEHPEIDFPFCLCWANENWTRAWDGQNRNVLIAQEYSEEDDKRFMVDLKKYIDDSRYIRINGKPLIMVYNPGQIPDCQKTFSQWRKSARELGIGEILIWTCQTANNTAERLQIESCIDAEVEFPPHNMWLDSAAVKNVDLGGKSAFLFDYSKIVDEIIKQQVQSNSCVPVHHGCMLSWDNAARRKDAWFTYVNFSLDSLYKWVVSIARKAREDFSEEERFVFINAWNEWGEGTYLEPDELYGYANINTVSKALFGLPLNDSLKVINESDCSQEGENFKTEKPRIVVQIHMFYIDTIDETIQYLNEIPYAFDCYISTDSRKKKNQIEKAFKDTCHCRKCVVEVFLNRGRDVAPFLVQMKEYYAQYDYIGHFHSKKTKTNDHGNEWRKYIFKHLLGNTEYLKRLFYLFEKDDKLGLIMPEVYPVLEYQAEWGGNKEGVENLLHKMNVNSKLPAVPVFPVGNMFWAKTQAIKPMFECGLTQNDFPEEAGQVNATIAHQIERAWVYIVSASGYSYQKVFNNCKSGTEELEERKRLLIYVHYSKEELLSEEDLKTIDKFSTMCSNIIFVTNSRLKEKDLDKIRDYTTHILCRENKGFDFGAWKEALLKYGRAYVEEYDELILLNNSCFAPVFDLQEMFSKMEKKNLDFWGNTVFPYSPDGTYIGKECIPEHLQSYFMVFNKSVLKSKVFWEFWENVLNYTKLIDVVANCESQFTKVLKDAGFVFEPYIKETYYLSRFLNNYAIPYEKPSTLVLLNDPFIKKKCYQYMNENEKTKLENILKKLNV